MKTLRCCGIALLLTASLAGGTLQPAAAAQNYQVWVSNEKSGDITIIDGSSLKVPWR